LIPSPDVIERLFDAVKSPGTPTSGKTATMTSMDNVGTAAEEELLAEARSGDPAAFERLVASYRNELYAHCYRMLGSVHDAEDALQESLLGAWRGLAGFAGRSSLRAWLYRISTNACLRLIARRPRRIRSADYGPPRQGTDDLGAPVTEPIWLEPWPEDVPADEPDPAASYLRREGVELAFVAALQHLPGTQRAVLILREVLEFSAAEAARILDTTPASVNSALQRARKAVEERVPGTPQQAELAALGADGQRELVDAFVTAWERADVRMAGTF
jgi:RNA polymerase sigma-70 factor (ECF subfamily)